MIERVKWNEGEIAIPYDPAQHELYNARDPTCVFHNVRWPLHGGRAKFGEFPLVVARATLPIALAYEPDGPMKCRPILKTSNP